MSACAHLMSNNPSRQLRPKMLDPQPGPSGHPCCSSPNSDILIILARGLMNSPRQLLDLGGGACLRLDPRCLQSMGEVAVLMIDGSCSVKEGSYDGR